MERRYSPDSVSIRLENLSLIGDRFMNSCADAHELHHNRQPPSGSLPGNVAIADLDLQLAEGLPEKPSSRRHRSDSSSELMQVSLPIEGWQPYVSHQRINWREKNG